MVTVTFASVELRQDPQYRHKTVISALSASTAQDRISAQSIVRSELINQTQVNQAVFTVPLANCAIQQRSQFPTNAQLATIALHKQRQLITKQSCVLQVPTVKSLTLEVWTYA